jgi:cytochrome c oxidase subunit 2
LRADATQFATVNQTAPPSKAGRQTLSIDVNGQQYIWRFSYPGSQPLFTYYEMVVPTDTTVVLRVTGSDVIHSWWIPKLGGKVDGVPGYINKTWFKIHKPGLYRGVCAELCGYGHADMRAVVRAVSPDRFEAWASRQRADIAAAQKALIVQRKQRERSAGTQ